jgi:hypothetical protein
MNPQVKHNRLTRAIRREREKTHLTLGGLIAVLEKMPDDTPVANLQNPGSYRGYYEDLYFEQNPGTRPAYELLADCKAALSKVFEGYRGGHYVMTKLTPLWIATYGNTGDHLLAIQPNGEIETGKYES